MRGGNIVFQIWGAVRSAVIDLVGGCNGTLPQKLPQRRARRWSGLLSPGIRSDSGGRATQISKDCARHRDAIDLPVLFRELRRSYLHDWRQGKERHAEI